MCTSVCLEVLSEAGTKLEVVFNILLMLPDTGSSLPLRGEDTGTPVVGGGA